MSKMRIFLPLRKVDEEQRLVYGTLTQEVLDKSGETFDYDGSKPYFEKWSDGIAKASGGKSVGNMRVMHTNKVAGIFTEMVFNDDDKAVEVCGKVIDDAEWEMVKAGGYTGFSIGGKYVKRFEVDGIKKFIADPSEGSLVDNPCVPTATFAMVKADGVEAEVPFQLWQPSNDEVAIVAQALAKADGGNWTDFIETARESLLKAKAEEGEKDDEDESEDEKDDESEEDGGDTAGKPKKGKGDEEDKKSKKAAAPSGEDGDWEQVWKTKDGSTFATKAEAVSHAAVLKAREAAEPMQEALAELEGAAKAADDKKKPYGDVKYADPKNGKYPIDTAKHIRAAWSYINMPKNQKGYTSAEVKSIKSKIIAAWKDKIDADGPPSAEKMVLFSDLAKSIKTLQLVEDTSVKKGLYTVSRAASCMACLADIAQSVSWEEHYENDEDSKLPQQAVDLLAAFQTFLVEMIQEETSELVASIKTTTGQIPIEIVCDDDSIMEMATRVVDLVKVDEDLLSKARSRTDKDKIQAMHDHSMAMGATCSKDNCGEMGETEKVAKADNDSLMKAENEELRKIIADTVPTIQKLQKQVQELMDQPMPAAPKTHVVGKGQDNGGGVEELGSLTAEGLIEKFGVEKLADAAIRIAQKKPISLVER